MFQGYMPPEAFSIDQSGEIIIMTVIGGPGTLIGPLVGAGVWTLLRQALQNVDAIAGVWKLILGVIFVLLITGFRRGLAGGAIAWWQRLRAAR
jgi:branched-chain amino acid transport system permease protein